MSTLFDLLASRLGCPHAWGLPGEAFAERLGVRMSPLD